ncbi:MAG: hypothetical protein Q7K21_08025 [Elusimicrobiota bacterium]|nr:hypothetical protein [Elusimicrobiota bacterium]
MLKQVQHDKCGVFQQSQYNLFFHKISIIFEFFGKIASPERKNASLLRANANLLQANADLLQAKNNTAPDKSGNYKATSPNKLGNYILTFNL